MKELTIPLEGHGDAPLYQQIYSYIKNDIKDGKLDPGEKLPSTRFLAKYLQISRTTVELAYDQLLSEGYTRTQPGSGHFVCEVLPEGFSMVDPQRKWGDGLPKCLETEAAIGTSASRLRYDFSPNAVEWPEFSMGAWRKANRSMFQEPMTDLFQSGDSLGELGLRQEISKYLHQARGVNCQLDQIVVGAGNEYLLMLLYQLLKDRGSVAMESPTYRQAYEIFCNLGWPVSAIAMDQQGMCVDRLRESGARLAYIMPSHQFPMGNVMPMGRRLELLQWAVEAPDRFIVEDDHDSEFRYKGKPIPSLQGSDPYDRVIYLGTFSKSIAPAIRVSYLVLPRTLLDLYQQRCSTYSSSVSRLQQQQLYYFMKEGYFERHLNKVRAIYRSRHETMVRALKGRNWVGKISGEHAGLHLLVEIRTAKKEDQLIREAYARGLRIYGLQEYRIETLDQDGLPEKKSPEAGAEECEVPPTLLLGYAGLEEEEILTGLSIMDEIV